MVFTVSKLGAEITVPTDYTLSNATVKQPYTKQDPRFESTIEQEIIFNSQPQTFTIPIPITVKDAVFYRQPPLTEQYKKNACSVWTETYVKEKTGAEHERPIDIVDSLAVYHSSKRGNTAATGKILHILRPKLIDKTGLIGWGKITYENDALVVTLPEEYMKTASYPVTVDPTFGYTSIGGSNDWWGSGNITFVCRYQAPANGTVTQVHYYGRRVSGSGNAQNCIYADSASAPAALLANSAAYTLTATAAWWAANVSLAITSGIYYWLGVASVGDARIYFDVGATDQVHMKYSYLPNPFGSPDYTPNQLMSVYATYTATNTYSPKTRSAAVTNSMMSMLNSKTLYS